MTAIRLLLAFVGSVVALGLALPIVVVGLPFWLTALLVRALAGRLQPAVARREDVFVYDPVLGWRPRPNLDVHWLAQRDDVFRIRTGPDGWHGTGTINDSDVVVFGDSHAFGYGVDPARTFASVVSDPRVKSLGAPGYNMVQELLLMREVQANLAGKMAVWFAYPGNDFLDNLGPGLGGYRTPFVREVDGGWEIVTRHLSPEKWTASVGRAGIHHFRTLAALYCPTYLAERAYRACAFLIGEGAELCRRAGARLVVMTIPSPLVMEESGLALLRSKVRHPEALDPDRPDREIRAICAKAGIGFVALKDHVTRSHFKPFDDHLTEAGHRRVAHVIRSTYRSGFGQGGTRGRRPGETAWRVTER